MNEEINKVIAGIEKDFGKGAAMKLGDKQPHPVETISTGSLGLDIALGVWGLPKGRIIEIYGPESSGKTTIATHVIAEAQKKGLNCAIIDAEHAFDSQYAEALGVDVDNLIIAQPDNGEQGLEIADRLIESGQFGVVVVDSVAALVPKAELEGEMGDSKMGAQARLMSQALRKMVGIVAKTNTILIFINQLRDKIGVMFGNPETTTGGNGLKFYASVRIDVRRSTTAENSIKNGDEVLGNLVKVKVVKNKVAPPFTKSEFDVVYGEGIDKVGEIISHASDRGLIKKWGKTITMEDKKYDLAEFTTLLNDNPDFYEELRNRIIELVKKEQESKKKK